MKIGLPFIVLLAIAGAAQSALASSSNKVLKCRLNGIAVCGSTCTGAGVSNQRMFLRIDQQAQIVELNGITGSYGGNNSMAVGVPRQIAWEFDIIRPDELELLDIPDGIFVTLTDSRGRATPAGGRQLEFKCK